MANVRTDLSKRSNRSRWGLCMCVVYGSPKVWPPWSSLGGCGATTLDPNTVPNSKKDAFRDSHRAANIIQPGSGQTQRLLCFQSCEQSREISVTWKIQGLGKSSTSDIRRVVSCLIHVVAKTLHLHEASRVLWLTCVILRNFCFLFDTWFVCVTEGAIARSPVGLRGNLACKNFWTFFKSRSRVGDQIFSNVPAIFDLSPVSHAYCALHVGKR